MLSTTVRPRRVLIQTYPFPIFTSTISGLSSVKITDIFFSVTTNVLGCDGITLANKSL